MDLSMEVWRRLQPVPPQDGGAAAWVVLGVVAAALLVPPLWRVTRVVVTAVHELGHGLVGVLTGRRFTGLVLRGDMSGHAVTVGPSRGAGRAVSTWAGYPAPGLVGAAALHLSAGGWAAPVLAATTAVLAVSLLRVRSLYTALVMVALVTGNAVLWWSGSALVQAQVLAGTGLFVLLGGWRHLGAVARHPGATSDPGVLARLTRVPAPLWLATFAVVLGVATWWATGPARLLLGA